MDTWVGATVNRREFLRGAGLASLALLAGCGRLPARAQSAPPVQRLGYLDPGPPPAEPDPSFEAFRAALRELGYAEGQNLLVETRYADGSTERLAADAAALAALPVNVIFAPGTLAARTAAHATSTVPIVFATASDPVGLGLVASLAHPGGNVTGASTSNAALVGKRLELLKDSFPSISRVARLFHGQDPSNRAATTQYQQAAELLGVSLLLMDLGGPESAEALLERAVRDGAEAVVVEASPLMNPFAAPIAQFTAEHRLPTMCSARSFVAAGALMSYAASFPAQFRKAATYVDKILKGARPAELPVEQPTVFELVVNLKLAQTLGWVIPQHVLLQATDLIQ